MYNRFNNKEDRKKWNDGIIALAKKRASSLMDAQNRIEQEYEAGKRALEAQIKSGGTVAIDG